MYISIAGNGYASAAISYRDEQDKSKVRIDYLYLGKVLDREKGIYQNRERGIFTFNPETQEFGVPPQSYVPPQKERKKDTRVCVDFGDSFFLANFIHKSGIIEAIDCISYGNRDTLHAMILFYTLSNLANYNATAWFNSSIVKLMYPNANITSQRISDFLAAVGTDKNQLVFQKAYIKFVMEHYSKDTNILIDSTGLPNSIHGSMTRYNVHNGKVSREIRLILVVQKSTGLPLYYQAVPGNIVDVSTLERTMEHIKALGIDIASCIMDAGYNSSENLDLFYDENHACKMGFITRVASNDKQFTTMMKENIGLIEQEENFVHYGDRVLYITHKQIMVGKNKDNPAWLYLGLDMDRESDEHHNLIRKAATREMSDADIHHALQTEGYFGIVSGTEYSNNEILPAYYQRQMAEQIFDFAKNYTKLLPLRTNNDATFNGHLLMSYIATCIIKMIQIRLKESNMYLGSRLDFLHGQKCIVYTDRVVTNAPEKEANETFKVFGINCPAVLRIKDGKLQYEMPAPTYPERREEEKQEDDVKIEQNDRSSENSADTEDTQQENVRSQESKEQKTIEPESQESPQQTPQVKRGRGRPKGSKNKKTIEREAMEAANPTPKVKRGRGRPKGSKNKKTIEREAMEAANPTPKVKRGPGRPKGSKNKRTRKEEAKVAKILAREAKQDSRRSQGSTNKRDASEVPHDVAKSDNSKLIPSMSVDNTVNTTSKGEHQQCAVQENAGKNLRESQH